MPSFVNNYLIFLYKGGVDLQKVPQYTSTYPSRDITFVALLSIGLLKYQQPTTEMAASK